MCTLETVNDDEEFMEVDINNDDSPELSSDVCSSDDEMPQEYWDGGSDNEIMNDLSEDDELETAQKLGEKDNVLQTSLVFLMLWTSFYGVSATALTHLIRFLHYVFSVLIKYVNSCNILYFISYIPLHVEKLLGIFKGHI